MLQRCHVHSSGNIVRRIALRSTLGFVARDLASVIECGLVNRSNGRASIARLLQGLMQGRTMPGNPKPTKIRVKGRVSMRELHCFQKKSEKTSCACIALATKRFKPISR